MKNNRSEENYQIKVNRISIENENLYPYKRYTKNDYSQLNKIAPKNSILYKFRLKPDIIINEYHQTSNNINTNINIKPNKPENSNINNSSINNINNFSFNNNYENNPNENSTNEKINNNINNIENYNPRKTDYISRVLNISDNNSNENNNSLLFSPFSNGYNIKNKDKEYRKRNIDYMKDINSNKYDNSLPSHFFQSPTEKIKNKNYIKLNNDYYYNIYETEKLNSKYMKKIIKTKNNGQEIIDGPNALNYKRDERESTPLNNINLYNKLNHNPSQLSIDSLRTKKMKEMNEIIFSSDNKYNNNINNRLKKEKNNKILISNNNEDNNNNNSLNIKLEYYRIKLFKEFFKHFQIFYKSYIKKVFIYFITKIKNYQHINKNNYIYNKKNYYKYSNTIENDRIKQSKILNNVVNHQGLDLFEVFKSSTMKNYYNIYNQLKNNQNIAQNLKKIFSSNSLNKEINNIKNNLKRNYSLSSMNNNKGYLEITPRLNKHLNYSTINRNQDNKSRILYNSNSNSKSPTFRIGNKTIINNDISFGAEGNERENELYRDSKELNKKYEQIQRRKKRSQSKNRENSISENKEISINKSAEIDNIKNSDEYNEFSELRQYLQALKFNKKEIDNSRNKKNKNVININSYEEKNVVGENENENKNRNNKNNINNINLKNNNYFYNRTHFNFHVKNDNFNKNQNKYINIRTNDLEEKIEMLKKMKESPNNKYKNNNIINDNENKNYKKVKVNINKKYLNINQELNSKNTINNSGNNYNYRIIKINSKLSNSPNKKVNIYYIKNKYNKIYNSEIIPKLIKDIWTKDKRIHINIFYYNFERIYNPICKKYYFLHKSNNYSMSLLGEKRRKKNASKIKFKLTSIKEEEASNQNSKIYDENTLGNNTNESKKNIIIKRQNELLNSQFIDIVENIFNNIYKKNFFKKIKKVYENRKNKIKNEYDTNYEKKINKRIYNRKNININKKVIGEE